MLASPGLHRRVSHDGDRLSGNILEASDPDLVKTWAKGYLHNISTCTGMGCQESLKYPDGNSKSPQRSTSQAYNHYDTTFGGLSLLNFYTYRYSTPFIWIRQSTDTDNHLGSAGPRAGYMHSSAYGESTTFTAGFSNRRPQSGSCDQTLLERPLIATPDLLPRSLYPLRTQIAIFEV